MKSVITVLKEQIDNFYLIMRLSLYELKNKNTSNYLGMAWEIINPSIQILIYWFVFVTLRERAPVEVNGMEIPFFIDRKSTRLNSSHVSISYAVFCLKKKKQICALSVV